LHKWDLSNYHSLRESTQKSHRRLLHFSFEFQKVLDTSARSVILEIDQSDAKEADENVSIFHDAVFWSGVSSCSCASVKLVY